MSHFFVKSEEDQLLKDQIETQIEKLASRDLSARSGALAELKLLISSSTSSITSVPKPLKFLSPHYGKLKDLLEAQVDQQLKVSFTLWQFLG